MGLIFYIMMMYSSYCIFNPILDFKITSCVLVFDVLLVRILNCISILSDINIFPIILLTTTLIGVLSLVLYSKKAKRLVNSGLAGAAWAAGAYTTDRLLTHLEPFGGKGTSSSGVDGNNTPSSGNTPNQTPSSSGDSSSGNNNTPSSGGDSSSGNNNTPSSGGDSNQTPSSSGDSSNNSSSK